MIGLSHGHDNTMTNPPFDIIGAQRPARWLVTCDHASNHVPADVAGGDLGLPPQDMARHIAYDIGAAGVTRHLSRLLDAPAILSGFSRLVIDPNRGDDDPTIMMRLYDHTIVPANRHADDAERQRRIAAYWRPYHDAYEKLAARRPDTVICAVHSYTPQLRGRPRRPWQVGILSAWDRRLADPVIASLSADQDLAAATQRETGERWVVGDNQPYPGHLPGDAIDQHALRHGRPNILIELRHDLIDTEAGQQLWAERLAPHLAAALETLPD